MALILLLFFGGSLILLVNLGPRACASRAYGRTRVIAGFVYVCTRGAPAVFFGPRMDGRSI